MTLLPCAELAAVALLVAGAIALKLHAGTLLARLNEWSQREAIAKVRTEARSPEDEIIHASKGIKVFGMVGSLIFFGGAAAAFGLLGLREARVHAPHLGFYVIAALLAVLALWLSAAAARAIAAPRQLVIRADRVLLSSQARHALGELPFDNIADISLFYLQGMDSVAIRMRDLDRADTRWPGGRFSRLANATTFGFHVYIGYGYAESPRVIFERISRRLAEHRASRPSS